MASLVIGTAGHVDHGKTALVRALTGVDLDHPASTRTRPPSERRALDRLKDEQQRGITIDLGFAHLRVGDVDLAFVDVPGHERFVRNMLAGAGGFDAVLLVVAADESVKPQTREHAAICRLLGVTHGVVALTKVDLVDPDTVALASLEVRDLAAGSFLAEAPIVPVSARTGDGLDRLVSTLVALVNPDRGEGRRETARLSVDRAFSAKGFGTIVTGTLVTGAVAEGDDLDLLPAGSRVRVRGLHVDHQPVGRAAAPQRVAVNLGHLALDDVRRGVTVATPASLAVTRRLDVELELLADARALPHGRRVRLHLGTADVGARIAVCAVRERGGDWQPAGIGQAAVAIPPGGGALVRLRLDAAIAATRLDRFVIRAGSPPTTVGGGWVLDPEPALRGVRRPTSAARFASLATDGATGGVPAVFLAEAGAHGLAAVDLVRRAGVGPRAAQATLTRWADDGVGVRAGDRVHDVGAVAAAEARLLAELKAAHDRAPAEGGVARPTLRERLDRGAAPGWFEFIVARLVNRGAVVGVDRLALAGRQPTVSAEEVGSRQAVEAALEAAGLVPPDVTALAAELCRPPAVVERAIHALVKAQRLVRLGDLVFHVESLSALKRDVRASAEQARAMGQTPELDVAAFKLAHGLSRKYAIPLLEWLDRERVTRRAGDRRLVL